MNKETFNELGVGDIVRRKNITKVNTFHNYKVVFIWSHMILGNTSFPGRDIAIVPIDPGVEHCREHIHIDDTKTIELLELVTV